MKTIAKSKAARKPAGKARTSARPAGIPPSVFTVRDMNRDTAKILEAARRHGRVTIRSRSGEEFKVEPVKPEPASGQRLDFAERMRSHRARLKALGYVPPGARGWAAISRAIAGER